MTIIRNNPQPRLSASVEYGNLVFLSGQTPKSSADDIALQTREVLEKIDALLAAAGSDKQHILSAQIWLKDISRDFAAFNEVWVKWMPEGHSPARAAVQAEMARPDILVEIMVTAVKA
ncbi:TPA: RidA family protein [Klebsiella aerogenes]|uniref:RidA family protein n=1 Tax=Klebsiella aerogenes TaxID=548 RepID=A0AAP9QSJ8_KLEAE|nr:RidA family protein [Klebsiella aerogenes]EKM7809443.1 RidA family protein [Klebsiella aerogenes]EKU4513695.1 RidA family protein [Klebsiella aerogenes]EKU7552922.1 RidA family protein [Klebsiella aerogenes]EKX4409406.1 RidA family protein [Klebsiella aerogenes]EKZ6360228.1 RidA family protein [Klebsiella aerogenes]